MPISVVNCNFSAFHPITSLSSQRLNPRIAYLAYWNNCGTLRNINITLFVSSITLQYTCWRVITDVTELVQQGPALSIFVVVSLAAFTTRDWHRSHTFLSLQIHSTDKSWTKIFSSDPAIVFLSRGVLLPFQHCLPAHDTQAKKKNCPPTPTFTILTSLLALRLLKSVTYTSPFSTLVPFVHIPRHPFTSGPRPNDSSFLLFSRCIRSERPLHIILVVRSGPASHYGSDLIRTYYRQGEIISGQDVAFCFLIIVNFFLHHASLDLATAHFWALWLQVMMVNWMRGRSGASFV
jgi:hypothetical protein